MLGLRRTPESIAKRYLAPRDRARRFAISPAAPILIPWTWRRDKPNSIANSVFVAPSASRWSS
jgi:hypothetical protein